MSKRVFQGFLLILLFMMAGCNPFTTNLYSGIDQYKNPSLTDANALLDASDEPQFYESLKNDPDAKAQVLQTLADVYNDPAADHEKQQEAALMAASVHLKTSDTEEVMSNLNSLVGDAVSGEEVYKGDTSGDGPEVFFRTVFGEPPASSVMSFSDYKALVKIRLTAFKEAAKPLEVYGETRDAGVPIPSTLNKGDTATKALMAGMTRTIIYYLGGTDPIDTLADYLATPKDSSGNLPPGLTYATEPGSFDGPTDMLVNPVTGSKGLVTVVNDGLDIDSLLK